MFRFVSLGIFAIVFILVKNVRKTRPSFVPVVPSVETLKNLIMVRRDRKGPIIPLWDEEKRLCGVQTNSGKDLMKHSNFCIDSKINEPSTLVVVNYLPNFFCNQIVTLALFSFVLELHRLKLITNFDKNDLGHS